MGGSSCPRLLRHQERGPLVGGVVRLSGGTVTLQDAVDAFLDHHDLARSTRRVYRASLASLVPGLGPLTRPLEIGPPDLDVQVDERPVVVAVAIAPGTSEQMLHPSGLRSPACSAI